MRRALAILAVCFSLPPRAFAVEDVLVGSTLLRPIGGRAIAMGEAYATAEDDIVGIHYNPAVLLKSSQLSMMYEDGIFDNHLGFVGVGKPFSFGQIAASVLYYDVGQITLTDTLGDTRSVKAQSDILTTLSANWAPRKIFSAGSNLKMFRSTLFDEFTGTSFLIDLGAMYRPTVKYSAGISLQNVGTKLNYASEAESLPRILRAGTSYKIRHFQNEFLVALDALKIIGYSNWRTHIGAEYSLGGLLAFRLGYRLGGDDGRFSLGFGLRWDKYSVDFAMVPNRNFGRSEQISLTIRL